MSFGVFRIGVVDRGDLMMLWLGCDGRKSGFSFSGGLVSIGCIVLGSLAIILRNLDNNVYLIACID